MEFDAYRSDAVNLTERFGQRSPGGGDEERVANQDTHRRNNDRRGHRNSRARSRSPPQIDQYRPNTRNRDDHRGGRDRDERRRASPAAIDRYVPGQDTQLQQPRVNPVINPAALDYPVGFNYFAEWWRHEQGVKEDEERIRTGRRPPRPNRDDPKQQREKERQDIQAAYDAYKLDLQGKIAKQFVQQHKNQEWFRERYVGSVRGPFREKLMAFRHGAWHQWQADLEAGVFDGFSLEGIYKNESNGAGGVVDREEGETVAAAEILGVGDLVPSRGADLRDESAMQPALLIKTLSPAVSREKVEELCREHLGDQDGGFQWLSLSDPNPQKKFFRMGWIMLHPEAAGEAPMERGDGRDEDDGGRTLPTEGKSSLLTTAEKAVDLINGKVITDSDNGNFTCHVGIHAPGRDPRKKALWDLFSAPERIERDLVLAKRLVQKFDSEFGDEADGLGQIERRVELLRLQDQLRDSSDQVNGQEMDLSGEYHDMHADETATNDAHRNGSTAHDNADDEDLLIAKKSLDLLVEYLRRVYNFCFFCVFETDSVHELVRKCPGGHLRRPRASLGSAALEVARASSSGETFPIKRRNSNSGDAAFEEPGEDRKQTSRGFNRSEQQLQRAFNWVRTFEEKLLQIIDPESADVKKLGGTPLEEGLDEELAKWVKQEDESKFRCKLPDCTKLFKGEAFWRKHVEKRHEEWFENLKNEISLVNAYVLDPARVTLARGDANNGQFHMNNAYGPHAGGTPRGFNYAQMNQHQQQMAMQARHQQAVAYAGFAHPAAFAGFTPFGHHAVQMPPGWMPGPQPMMDDGSAAAAAAAAAAGMMPQPHMAGPMRRGGGRFNRNSGPYERRPRQGQMSPTQGMGGMPGMMPGGMMGNRGPNMRWADGAGMSGMGPQEALQGRSVKSYEDLDAVGGGAGGELDY